MSVVSVNNLTVTFRMNNEHVNTIKEYVVKKLKRELTYTDFNALNDVSFSIEKGDVLGIIGHNGAGKSTLLKVISRILVPTAGTVDVKGNVVPMLELGSGFDMEMNGRENVFLNGAILGYSDEFLHEKYDEIVEFAELNDFMEVPLRNYSSGMVMRLAFSIATEVKPEILIVDEILAVGDMDFQEKSRKRMMELMGGGTTVLFVSHALEQIRDMCNKVLWIEKGKVVDFGDTQELCDRYENKE